MRKVVDLLVVGCYPRWAHVGYDTDVLVGTSLLWLLESINLVGVCLKPLATGLDDLY